MHNRFLKNILFLLIAYKYMLKTTSTDKKIFF